MVSRPRAKMVGKEILIFSIPFNPQASPRRLFSCPAPAKHEGSPHANNTRRFSCPASAARFPCRRCSFLGRLPFYSPFVVHKSVHNMFLMMTISLNNIFFNHFNICSDGLIPNGAASSFSACGQSLGRNQSYVHKNVHNLCIIHTIYCFICKRTTKFIRPGTTPRISQ